MTALPPDRAFVVDRPCPLPLARGLRDEGRGPVSRVAGLVQGKLRGPPGPAGREERVLTMPISGPISRPRGPRPRACRPSR
ncbi:MAG: DUF2478 domain-containing protein [Desulfobacterales bacterium]|nr:DUF2478 domain-containing protein [Desulfobacterales bacterium]